MAFTNEETKRYVAAGGIRCPKCGSEDLSGGSVEINAGTAEQSVSCQDCTASWTDVYTLTEIEET